MTCAVYREQQLEVKIKVIMRSVEKLLMITNLQRKLFDLKIENVLRDAIQMTINALRLEEKKYFNQEIKSSWQLCSLLQHRFSHKCKSYKQT